MRLEIYSRSSNFFETMPFNSTQSFDVKKGITLGLSVLYPKANLEYAVINSSGNKVVLKSGNAGIVGSLTFAESDYPSGTRFIITTWD